MVFNIWEKLDKQIKENIINKVYSRQELDRIYSKLKEEVDMKKIGFSLSKYKLFKTDEVY